MLEFAHSPSVSRPPFATTPPFSIYGGNFLYAYTSQIVCRRIDSVCVWMMQKILSIALNWNDNDALSKRQEIPAAATDDRSLNKRTHKKLHKKGAGTTGRLFGWWLVDCLGWLAGWLAGWCKCSPQTGQWCDFLQLRAVTIAHELDFAYTREENAFEHAFLWISYQKTNCCKSLHYMHIYVSVQRFFSLLLLYVAMFKKYLKRWSFRKNTHIS